VHIGRRSSPGTVVAAAALAALLSGCAPAVTATPPAARILPGARVVWSDGTTMGRLGGGGPSVDSNSKGMPSSAVLLLLSEVSSEALRRGTSLDVVSRPETVIRTTFDRPAQQAAVREVARTDAADSRHRLLSGLVAVKPSTGEVLAEAGTADDGRLLVSTPEPTGSVFKVFTLLAAARAGIPLTAQFDARSPQTLRGGAVISNFSADPSPAPMVTLETATAHSLNVVFAKLAVDELGLPSVIAAAHAAGIPPTVTPSPQDPFTSLGNTPMTPKDVANAYATVQSGGLHCQVHVIASSSAPGLVPIPPCQRVFEPDVVAETNQALRSVVDAGTGRRAKMPGRIVVGKTGTAQGNLSAWFAGSTGDLTAVAVVVGSKQRPLLNIAGRGEVTGSSLPTDLWRDFVNSYLTTPQPRMSQ